MPASQACQNHLLNVSFLCYVLELRCLLDHFVEGEHSKVKKVKREVNPEVAYHQVAALLLRFPTCTAVCLAFRELLHIWLRLS